MPWYKGPALLTYLEDIDVSKKADESSFTMPVQRVCRPDHNFRGFQGQIESGAISVGDTITVLPSKETSTVKEIIEGDKSVQTSSVGHPVTISLNTEIDVSRGCVLTNKPEEMCVTTMFAANLLWMDDSKLVEGKNYLIKIGTERIPATVLSIRHKIDVNTGKEVPADAIYKNEIAKCHISVSANVAFDVFENNKALGSLILIDRVSHATAACGVIVNPISRSNNLTWHTMDVTKEFRENQLGQKSKTIWFTGLSCSGKSTLANELEKRLAALGKHTMLLDGDNVRMGLNKNLGFTEADRIENIRRVSEVAKLMNDAGLIVLTSFISPFERDRMKAKEIIGEDFVEIYVSTPLEECEKRDIKGLYAAARAGRVQRFTGISSPYEAPKNPLLSIDTSKHTIDECVDMILESIKDVI